MEKLIAKMALKPPGHIDSIALKRVPGLAMVLDTPKGLVRRLV